METLKRWSSIFVPKLKTLEEKSDEQTKILFPVEILEDIISRLPAKSILRFRSVSKPWLSLISNPSFTKLQLTRTTLNPHVAFLITAFDTTTLERHLLSAPRDGGSVTHLMTIGPCNRTLLDTETQHSNGLVCCISDNCCVYTKEIFIVNPSTREFLILPDPDNYASEKLWYFFGFDEGKNEHKILRIADHERLVIGSTNATIRIMIFSMSNHSWRKLDASVDSSVRWFQIISSVCVNSTVHLLVLDELREDRYLGQAYVRTRIWAFDLRTEKFAIVNIPDNIGSKRRDSKHAYLLKINGRVGLVSHRSMAKTNQMHIWILQDYENHVWVKETIEFPKAWMQLSSPYPLDSVNGDEIIFSVSKLSRSVISAHIYNMKSGCFRSIKFTLDLPILFSDTVQFHHINCYVESIMPLQWKYFNEPNLLVEEVFL